MSVMQNRNKTCSSRLHRNDEIRSDEARRKAGFSATFCMFTLAEALLIFYQCKINVCDFGGKLIRLEAAVQIKLFKGKQTNAIWCFG